MILILNNSVATKFTTTELFDLLRTNIIEEDDTLRKFGNSELSGKKQFIRFRCYNLCLVSC